MTEGTLRLPARVPSRQARARALREELESAPGGARSIPRGELLELLAPPAGEDPVEYAQCLLVQHGIRPGSGLSGDPLSVVRLEPTVAYAVQGAAAVTLAAVVVGFVGLWAYGLIFAAAGGLATLAVARRYDLVRRRAPHWLPGGRLLGAAAALIAIVVAALLVVLPIRESRAR